MAVLSVTQIVSWGVLYYAFAALSSSIADDTGWSSVAITGAFSTSQLVAAAVGIVVGRRLDRRGPRVVMSVGTLVAVPGVLVLAGANALPTFFVGWTVTGAAMACVLYPPAFAALTRWAGPQRVRALTTLTLVAGLASTVFAPLASGLDDVLGWRVTYAVLAGGLLVVTLPLHWWGLRHPWTPDVDDGSGSGSDPGGVALVLRSRSFLLLGFSLTLTSLCVFAVVINLVPMLIEQGMTRNQAAVALGLSGVGQVAGRLGYARLAEATTAEVRTAIVIGGVALSTAALALSPTIPAVLTALGIATGLARGVFTLIQATAVTDRWGSLAYGTLNGALTAPSLGASASAPFAGAALAAVLGSYQDAFLVLSAVAAVAVAMAWRATAALRSVTVGQPGCADS